jgi:hypothetical protein
VKTGAFASLILLLHEASEELGVTIDWKVYRVEEVCDYHWNADVMADQSFSISSWFSWLMDKHSILFLLKRPEKPFKVCDYHWNVDLVPGFYEWFMAWPMWSFGIEVYLVSLYNIRLSAWAALNYHASPIYDAWWTIVVVFLWCWLRLIHIHLEFQTDIAICYMIYQYHNDESCVIYQIIFNSYVNLLTWFILRPVLHLSNT